MSSLNYIMLMKIAIPIWQDRVSPVFDTANNILIVNFKDNQEISRVIKEIDSNDILQKCTYLVNINTDILICGAISRPLLRMLNCANIEVIFGITGQINTILQAYIDEALFKPVFFMPGFGKRLRQNGFMKKQRRKRRGRK